MELRELKIGDFVEFVASPKLGAGNGEIMLNESARWYCAIVRPTRHLRAEFELGRLGCRAFHPKTRKWASHARTKVAVERPILGRYLFVEVDHPRQSFEMIRSVFHVESLVSNVGRPIPFPAHWVEGLLSRYMAGEWDEVSQGKIPVGARIRIVEGEFQDQLALVTGTKGRRVDFRLLGSATPTRIDQSSVRAA